MFSLKAGSQTSLQALAGSIAINIRKEGAVVITVVGAGALNQAVKSIIIARRFLKADGNMDLSVKPFFSPLSGGDIDSEKPIVAIKLLVKQADICEEEDAKVLKGDNEVLDSSKK